MFRNYQYRLKPTAEQEIALDFLFWQGRKVWNEALAQRIAIYEEKRGNLNAMDQWPRFRDLRSSEPDALGKLSASAMNYVLRRLDKAFNAFYRRVKEKKSKPGFPHFKNRYTFNSLEFKYGNGCKLRYDKTNNPWLYVMNVGLIKLTYHRPIPNDATAKQIVIRRHANEWDVSIMLQTPDVQNKRAFTGQDVGVDTGLLSLLAYSDGTLVDNPRWLRESLVKLRVLNRRAARQVKGSKRQKQTYAQIAKLHNHIANQRKDFWHKITRGLVVDYDLIAIEDMTYAFMNQSKHLARSSYDAALGMFKPLLAYKAEETGARLAIVNPRNTSQLCSGCGEVVGKNLKVRIHRCSNCGLTINRDVNAARNILRLA